MLILVPTAVSMVIGSMSMLVVNDEARANATAIIVATMVTPPQFFAFAMVSLGLESQNDMHNTLVPCFSTTY